MKQVFEGKHQASWRHQHYKAGGAKQYNLNYNVPVGPFTDEQYQAIVSYLMGIYCVSHKRYLKYVMKVLVSEMLIAIFMDIHGISDPEDAEAKMGVEHSGQ